MCQTDPPSSKTSAAFGAIAHEFRYASTHKSKHESKLSTVKHCNFP
ncbi:MAG: hypothetical protein ACR2LR_11415 [Hassallia sp.]